MKKIVPEVFYYLEYDFHAIGIWKFQYSNLTFSETELVIDL